MHKTLLDLIERKIKTKTSQIRDEKIANEFRELREFKQSSTKHWNLLHKLGKGLERKLQSNTKVDNEQDNPKIAEKFSECLAETFKKSTEIEIEHTLHSPNIDISFNTIYEYEFK